MKNTILNFVVIFPFLIQGIGMIFDEFVFHHRRGLPRWERWGHPLDTISVLIPFLMVLFLPFSAVNFLTYLSLALFSCFLITKDEWVHHHFCEAMEQWVHALLFILHPWCFFSAGFIWSLQSPAIRTQLKDATVNFNQDFLNQSVIFQVILILSFLVYQILYWGVFHERRNKNQQHPLRRTRIQVV